jgi:hypothetical protein
MSTGSFVAGTPMRKKQMLAARSEQDTRPQRGFDPALLRSVLCAHSTVILD